MNSASGTAARARRVCSAETSTPVTWKAGGEALRVGHACTAAELEYAYTVLQPRHELFLPLAARIADDPVAPFREALADGVVASTDKLGPRISQWANSRAWRGLRRP